MCKTKAKPVYAPKIDAELPRKPMLRTHLGDTILTGQVVSVAVLMEKWSASLDRICYVLVVDSPNFYHLKESRRNPDGVVENYCDGPFRLIPLGKSADHASTYTLVRVKEESQDSLSFEDNEDNPWWFETTTDSCWLSNIPISHACLKAGDVKRIEEKFPDLTWERTDLPAEENEKNVNTVESEAPPVATTGTLAATPAPALPQGKPRESEITQEAAAQKLGVNVRTIRNWESGKTPAPKGYPGRYQTTAFYMFVSEYTKLKSLRRDARAKNRASSVGDMERYSESADL